MIVGVAVVLVLLIVFRCRSPLKGKWYYIEDDDFWLDISYDTIKLRSVTTDDVYGTMKYKYNKSTKKIKIGKVTSTGINNICHTKSIVVQYASQENTFPDLHFLCGF